MKQEDKELLLKDLCARLPYGVIVHSLGIPHEQKLIGYIPDIEHYSIKPYLRSMSTMTDKELVEFLEIKGLNLKSEELKTFRNGQTAIVSTLPSYSRHIDWLNKHHFDYRGLIKKGLAFEI